MKKKIVRVTTVPSSLKVLLKGQLKFINNKYDLIAVSSPGKELKDIEDDEGVRTYAIRMTRRISPLIDLISIYILYKFLRKESPLIVHSHTPKAGFVAMAAAFFAGVPNRLHTIAGLPLVETKGMRRKILLLVEKVTYYLATLIIPNSFGQKSFIIENNLTSESKVKILGNGSSNGIDLFFFNPPDIKSNVNETKIKFNIQSSFIYLFIGRLVGAKGINELISSFVKIHELYQDTGLILLGDFEDELDPLSINTEKLINNTNIYKLGFQNDVRSFLEVADVFVFPSYREGFPNSVLQACAYNLPCIVTDINGCNEIISDGENGLIIPPKSELDLKNAMEKLYIDNELRLRLGSNNRKKVMELYDQKLIWSELLRLYDSL